MKKVFDQTMRDIKRGVNKKVLKVSSIEQKVLDSTSNEPWGPHGSLLADIANATRNYNEYQIIMSVIWKRINDTGKNWRHVYKALTVLEYLVAHGSECVIDEIREHSYQINTLSDFQYVDSSGRDQGSNVRKKSQCLVVLVNDKERIQEVRQKASAIKDKYRSMSMGSKNMHHSSPLPSRVHSDRYDYCYSDRYGIRDGDRNGYGREREWSSRDDDRYSRYGDSYGRDGDSYNRDYHGTGTSRSNDDEYNYGPRSRSFDIDRDIAYDGSGQHSSRKGSGARTEDLTQNGSPFGKLGLVRRFSEQNLAPPSYEETNSPGQSPTHSPRDVETSPTPAPEPLSNASKSQDTRATVPEPSGGLSQASAPENNNTSGSDDHNAPSTSAGHEMDLLSSLFESSPNSLAIVPAGSLTGTSEGNSSDKTNSEVTIVAAASSSTSSVANQGYGNDPFGDGPFKAIPYSNETQAQPPEPFQSNNNQQEQSTSNQEIDILAGILPPPPHVYPQFPNGQCTQNIGFSQPPVQYYASSPRFPPPPPQAMQLSLEAFPSQPTSMACFGAQADSQMANHYCQTGQSGFPYTQFGSFRQVGFQPNPRLYGGHNNYYYNTAPMVGSLRPFPSMNTTPQVSSSIGDNTSNLQNQSFTMQTMNIPASSAAPNAQPINTNEKLKFETKSTIWSDSLNRGLVNLNISGPKTNPLDDIGIDFEAMNRKEKRMEKPANTIATSSTVMMGKAMGSGSGIGRAGAGALRPMQTQMLSPSSAHSETGGFMGGYGYGGLNQPPIGMGIGINRPMNMNMNMGMGQGMQQMQQQPTGFPPGPNIASGNYYPLPGTNGYGQLPFGRGYR